MLRKVEWIDRLIPTQPRGGNDTNTIQHVYGFYFTDVVHNDMLQDPKCNTEVFNKAKQEAADVFTIELPENGEIWFISEQGLLNAGLGHWQNRGTS